MATPARPDMDGDDRVWKAASTLTGVLGAMVAKKLLRAVYRSVRKDTDPDSPFDLADARFSWSEALLWAIAAGVGLGVAKVVSGRLAAIGWKAATGKAPPVLSST